MKLFLVLMLLASPCLAQDAVKYDVLQGYWGITFCTDRGAYSFVMTGLSAIDDADTKRHEAKHIEQYHRYPDCKAWQAYYRTPRGKLAAEAEAYHAGWCVAVRMGADSISLAQSYYEKMEHILGGTVNRLEVIQEFKKYTCKDTP